MIVLNSLFLGTIVALTLAGLGQYVLKALRIRKLLPEAGFAVSLAIGAVGCTACMFFSVSWI